MKITRYNAPSAAHIDGKPAQPKPEPERLLPYKKTGDAYKAWRARRNIPDYVFRITKRKPKP